MLQINHILLLLILLAFPHGLPDHRFMLQFVLTAPPQDHEPSISSTISLPICEPLSISPTSYRNSPMGPPPFISFPEISASPGAFILHWGTRFCILYIFPNYLFFLVQTPVITTFVFVVTVGDLLSFWPHATHVTLGWSIPSHFPLLTSSISSEHDPGHFPLSSAFIYLVPPLAQLTSDLVVPMTLDLVPTVAATPYIIHPPTKGSLESSHFLTSSMYLCHFITSVDSTEYLFASRSRVSLLSTSAHFSERATVSWSSFPIKMRDLGRHRGKHHCSLMSLTPITFDANTFSCCGGSYFATIAVFFLPKTSELGRATTAHITVVVSFRDHYHWFRVCSFAELSSAFIIPPPRALQCLHQQFTHFIFRVTLHEHGACPPHLYTFVYYFTPCGRSDLQVPLFSNGLLYTVSLLLSLTTLFSVKETLMNFGYTFCS
jgi:hypothetical protein